MSEPVEIDIQLTEKDYRDVLKEQSMRAVGKLRLWAYGVYILIVLIILVQTIMTTNQISLFTFMPLIIITVIIGLSMYNIRQRSKFLFQSDALIQKPFKVTIDDIGLSVKSETSDWHLNWTEVYDFNITKHAILIYLSPIRALVIPERFIPTAQQIERISNILFAKVSKETN